MTCGQNTLYTNGNVIFSHRPSIAQPLSLQLLSAKTIITTRIDTYTTGMESLAVGCHGPPDAINTHHSTICSGVRSMVGVLRALTTPTYTTNTPTQKTIRPPQNPSYTIDGQTHQTPIHLGTSEPWHHGPASPNTALETGFEVSFDARRGFVIAADALGCTASMAGSGGVGGVVEIFDQTPYERLSMTPPSHVQLSNIATQTIELEAGLT